MSVLAGASHFVKKMFVALRAAVHAMSIVPVSLPFHRGRNASEKGLRAPGRALRPTLRVTVGTPTRWV